MMKIALLASGSLGFVTLNSLSEKEEIIAVFTDKKSKEIIDLCTARRIPCFIGNPRNGRAAQFISGIQPYLLLSVNYLFLIEDDLISWPRFLPLNVHGSLLPKYRGRTPHVWAIINNESEAGITVHVIDEKCDTGDIVAQKGVLIEENDTGADILNKYASVYPEVINDVISKVKSNNLERTKQDESLATYFGKRTPEDGKINWDWQKERIRNWVRAQSNPYPGAFSMLGNAKVIIDEIRYSSRGFHFTDPNGTVLSNNSNPVVKCQNGTIELINIRGILPSAIKPGQILT